MILLFRQIRPCRLILALCLLISCLSSSAYSLEEQNQDALPSIPSYLKEGLINRLDTFVMCYRNKQFDMVYEMLSPAYRRGMRNADGSRPSKEEWIKEQEEWRENVGNRGLLDFKLVKAVLIQDSWEQGLVLKGCIQFETSNERYKYETHAFYENGEWHFWDIVQEYSCVNCEPELCGQNATAQ